MRPPAPLAPPAELDALARELCAWYRGARRDLPWRRTRDPYAIWVSEIMLQQTRVETATGYYQRFLDRFPTVAALSRAPLDDVLAVWAGLGYYGRARNLHAAAREVATRYGGRLPDDPAALAALPGVGRYTAGAIASIAFGRPAPLVDGNVARVLSRLFLVEAEPRSPAGQRTLWALAAALVARADPSELNQGLMELGATRCAPRTPACGGCPLAGRCRAHAAGRAAELPLARARPAPATLELAAAIVTRRGRLLLARRAPRGLFGGLWELPTVEPAAHEAPEQALARLGAEALGTRLAAGARLEPVVHLLTHRRLRVTPFSARAGAGTPRAAQGPGAPYDRAAFVAPADAGALGISALTARLIAVHRADRS